MLLCNKSSNVNQSRIIEGQVRGTCQELETIYTNLGDFLPYRSENPPNYGLIGSERGLKSLVHCFLQKVMSPDGFYYLFCLPPKWKIFGTQRILFFSTFREGYFFRKLEIHSTGYKPDCVSNISSAEDDFKSVV